MLAANGYSAAFPFLQHLANNAASSQHQQLAAAAAALGLPGLPSSRLVSHVLSGGEREVISQSGQKGDGEGMNEGEDVVSAFLVFRFPFKLRSLLPFPLCGPNIRSH